MDWSHEVSWDKQESGPGHETLPLGCQAFDMADVHCDFGEQGGRLAEPNIIAQNGGREGCRFGIPHSLRVGQLMWHEMEIIGRSPDMQFVPVDVIRVVVFYTDIMCCLQEVDRSVDVRGGHVVG